MPIHCHYTLMQSIVTYSDLDGVAGLASELVTSVLLVGQPYTFVGVGLPGY